MRSLPHAHPRGYLHHHHHPPPKHPHPQFSDVGETEQGKSNPDKRLIGRIFRLWSPLFFIISLGLIGTFMLLDFLLGKDVTWPPLIVAIVLAFYIYGVWFYLLYTLMNEYKRPAEKYVWIPFVEFLLIATITVVHNGLLYSSIGKIETDAYITVGGVSAFGDLSIWRRNWISLYFATETTLTLGTGTIFVNGQADAPVGPIPVFFNLAQSIFLYTWVSAGMWVRVKKHNKAKRNLHNQ
jgi:hypothetical protein